MIGLVDGDELIYKACVTPITFLNEADEVDVTGVETFSDAVTNLKNLLSQWQEKAEATDVVICLSCRDRKLYRKHFYPTYKANRGSEKPKFYWELVDYAIENFQWVEEPGLEADDVMGVLTGIYEDNIIISSDKDMDTIPGKRYSPYHDAFYETTEYMADYNWLKQSLTGDSSDGYSGAKGIGKMKAAEVLAVTKMAKNFDFAYEHVLKMFEFRGQPKEEAIANIICARILRFSDVKKEGTTLFVDIPKINKPFYVASILASM
jgi:DNA polymerase-1